MDSERKIKATQCDTNSSTIDLQKLTHNIDGMIETIANLSVIKPNRKSNSDNNLSLLFKAGGAISAIRQSTEEVVSPPIHTPPHYQESYGLEAIKPKRGKKTNKMCLRSMQKINGFEEKRPPQTPEPRLIHALGEYEEVKRRKTHSRERDLRLSQRKKLAEPMSPGSQSSSSLSNSKRLLKSSSKSSSRGR